MSRMILSDFTIYEILEKVAEVKTQQEKVEVIKKYDNGNLRKFFHLIFDPYVKFSFPIPKHAAKDTRPEAASGTLKSYLGTVVALSDGGRYGTLPEEKRTRMAKNVLDAISKKEADLLTNLLKKKLKFKGVTEMTIRKAYSGIIKFDDRT